MMNMRCVSRVMGKTESGIYLNVTREAYLYYGVNREVTREEFKERIKTTHCSKYLISTYS